MPWKPLNPNWRALKKSWMELFPKLNMLSGKSKNDSPPSNIMKPTHPHSSFWKSIASLERKLRQQKRLEYTVIWDWPLKRRQEEMRP